MSDSDKRAVIEQLRRHMRDIEAAPSLQDPNHLHRDCAFEPMRQEAADAIETDEPFVGDLAASDASNAQDDGGSLDATKAFAHITRIVSHADKSEKQLRQRLKRDGYEEAVIDESIERALACGIIDDSRYAESFVRAGIRAGKGIAGLERKLLDAGIPRQMIPADAFEESIGSETELQRALAVLKRNPPRSKNLRDGAYRKLISRGYSSAVASEAARSWSISQDNATA